MRDRCPAARGEPGFHGNRQRPAWHSAVAHWVRSYRGGRANACPASRKPTGSAAAPKPPLPSLL